MREIIVTRANSFVISVNSFLIKLCATSCVLGSPKLKKPPTFVRGKYCLGTKTPVLFRCCLGVQAEIGTVRTLEPSRLRVCSATGSNSKTSTENREKFVISVPMANCAARWPALTPGIVELDPLRAPCSKKTRWIRTGILFPSRSLSSRMGMFPRMEVLRTASVTPCLFSSSAT